MADPVLLDDCRCWLGGVDISGSVNSVEMTAAKAELANSRMGDTLEVLFQGLEQVVANAGGFWESATSTSTGLNVDSTLFSRFDTGTGRAMTFAPPDAPSAAAGAEGNIAYTVVGRGFEYNISGAHGELLSYNFRQKPASEFRLYRQQIVLAKQTFTATSTGLVDTGVSYAFPAVATGEKMVATLHVFQQAGDAATFTVTVESDTATSWGSATTRFTFTDITDVIGAEITQTKKLSGAITDTKWRTRVIASSTGVVNVAVLLGIARD